MELRKCSSSRVVKITGLVFPEEIPVILESGVVHYGVVDTDDGTGTQGGTVSPDGCMSMLSVERPCLLISRTTAEPIPAVRMIITS